MDLVQIELLGFVAGATNLFSSVPQLFANLSNPCLAKTQSCARNAFQCAGNSLWVIYAISVGSLSMMIFASLGSAMAGFLLVQTYQAKRRASLAARHSDELVDADLVAI